LPPSLEGRRCKAEAPCCLSGRYDDGVFHIKFLLVGANLSSGSFTRR
jgi:hypothetical protein